MNKIKIAQIGIGHNHGSEKMRTVLNFPEVYAVVGVCEGDPVWIKSRGALDVYCGLPFMCEEELLNVPSPDADSEAAETQSWLSQSWLEFALRCNYITQEMFDECDAAYEKIRGGLVNMISNADQWCQVHPPVKEDDGEYR